MLECTDNVNQYSYQSARCSVSTIDSITAEELINQQKNLTQTFMPSSKVMQTQSNSISPKVQNTMTFDKNNGIHVGDVINYYCGPPLHQVPINGYDDTKSQSTNCSENTLISSDNSKKRKFPSIYRKRTFLFILISLIIITITGSMLFMTRHKLVSIDTEEITTIKIITTTSEEIEIDSTTTTTPESSSKTTTVEVVTPTIPPEITLEAFVSRRQWNAEDPRAKKVLNLPISRIIVAHTASDGCDTEKDCTKFVQELQKSSIHLDDIPYNFLIGNDSKVYEGRGFEYQGQHTSNTDATEYDSIGICIAFIGNYEIERISESQEKVFKEFIKYFVDSEIIHQNYTIFLQDQLMRTEVPLNGLKTVVESWKGFKKLQKIYHRSEWKADNARYSEKFINPMNWSIITSTDGKECNSLSRCSEFVKNMQLRAFNTTLLDIPFAFVIGGDGLIFEGRGWDYIGEHTVDFNTRTIGICVIGSFGVKKPSQAITDATYKLLQDGAALGKLTNDFKINGRQELSQNLRGPGGDFMTIIRRWPEWKFLGFPKE